MKSFSSRRKGKRIGFVVVNVWPDREPHVLADTEGRIFPTEEAANSEAHRLQEKYSDPFVWVAEVVLPPEPDIEIRADAVLERGSARVS